MSRQIKKKYIKKYKIKISKLQNKIYELDYLLHIKYYACDELLKENKTLIVENSKLRELNRVRFEEIELLNHNLKRVEDMEKQNSNQVCELERKLKDKDGVINNLMHMVDEYRTEDSKLRAEIYLLKIEAF